MDPLSDLLRVVRLDGAYFYSVEAADPWRSETVAAGELSPRIMPAAEHLISYHIVTEGRCVPDRNRGGTDAGRGQADRGRDGGRHQRDQATAAAAIRALSDEQLDRAAAISLNADAPLTCQFWLEDHPVRHSYHHLAKIRATLGR